MSEIAVKTLLNRKLVMAFTIHNGRPSPVNKTGKDTLRRVSKTKIVVC